MPKTTPVKNEIIGSIELISFPESRIKYVPARVDTGAIYSSIWASGVQVQKGVLKFALFAPGSSFYNGKVMEATNYRTSSVKSSFGQKEFRYKVRLQVKINNRTIRAWFTLADRSGMNYPVLIGRNILRHKFIVDVSKHRTHETSSTDVLVLASQGHDFDGYFQDVKKLSANKINYVVRDYKDLIFSIEPGKVSVEESITGRNISDFDLVYFKSHKRDYSVAIATAQYANFKGIKIIDQEMLSQISYDKLSEYMRLALNGLPIPYTFCAPTSYLLNNIDKISKKTGWPLICKEIESDKGRKNFILDNPPELKAQLKRADSADTYVIQKYIPNDGFIRALVFDRDVSLAIHRATIERDEKIKRHLNKLPYSENATLLKLKELDPQVHDLSVRSAVVMNRQVAGVDIIQNSKTKEWFILEVNNAPQVRSGPFLEERKQAVANFFDSQMYT